MEIIQHPPVLRMIARGARRRCPYCGGGRLFSGYLDIKPACPTCGLKLDRGEGDFFLGAYAVNFVTAELLLALLLAGFVALTWPDTPWTTLLYSGLALMIVAPIAFFPFSRTIWLAIDLSMREATVSDFVTAEGTQSTETFGTRGGAEGAEKG